MRRAAETAPEHGPVARCRAAGDERLQSVSLLGETEDPPHPLAVVARAAAGDLRGAVSVGDSGVGGARLTVTIPKAEQVTPKAGR